MSTPAERLKDKSVERPSSASGPLRIPDYELLRLIGRGSYGEVWLARGVTGAHRAAKIIHRRPFDSAPACEREFRGIQKLETVSRFHDSQLDLLHVGCTHARGSLCH